ncbi:conserved hypothetical protein [Burkholderia pseudomallei 576]|nr:conserved hypothetical protein [Burkholderia pseudomallei 576]
MLGHAGRSRFNGVLAAARQAFAGVQQAFSRYSAGIRRGGAKRSPKGAAKTRRMCRECPAESTPAMRARPLVRSSAERAARAAAARCGTPAASRPLSPPRARASENARPSP